MACREPCGVTSSEGEQNPETVSSLSSSSLPSAMSWVYELSSWIEPGEHNAFNDCELSERAAPPICEGRNFRQSMAVQHFPRTSGSEHCRHAWPFMRPYALAKGGRVSRVDVLTWVDELIWREFFQQVLASFPHVVEGPFRKAAVPPARPAGSERDRLFRTWWRERPAIPSWMQASGNSTTQGGCITVFE